MCGRGWLIPVLLALLAGPVSVQTALAQTGVEQTEVASSDQQPLVRAPILTLDDQRLFNESRFGKAVIAAQEVEKQALITENRKIEAGLEAEERDLTARRQSLTKEQFAPLSEAFNTKVEGIRAAQEVKSRDLTRRLEEQRRRFFDTASPVLGQIMAERGAMAIIDKRAVFIGFDNIDVTDAAIARLDEVLGDGGALVPLPVTPNAPTPALSTPTPSEAAPNP